MIVKKLKPGTVLVKISKADKRKIFNTDIENASGEVVSLIKALESGSETDEYFSQGVEVGEVVAIADDISLIKVGDLVAIDYMADTDEERIAYYDNGEKIVSLDANTKYHTEDRIAFASMRTRMDTFTWRKGDVESQSWIYAIVRDGLLIPNNDFILLEHKNLTWTGDNKSGINYFETEGDIVIRKVISAAEGLGVMPGDLIAVETFALLERSIEKYNFDIIMSIDLLGTIEKN